MSDIHAAVLAQLAEQGALIAELQGRLGDQDHQVKQLDGLVSNLTLKVGLNSEFQDSYSPKGNVKWWALTDEERSLQVGRVNAWVRDILQPGFGHLAKRLPNCWAVHMAAVTWLDVLCELHLTLYLPKHRSASLLAGQAEYWIRIAPALLDLVARECRDCEHGRAPINGHATLGGAR